MLRDYQHKLKNDVYEAWQAGHRNVLAVSPTGSGKTKVKASIFSDCREPAIAIAHRQELVGQISSALAEQGVVHRIIAPKHVIQFCITQHVRKFGKSYHHPQSPVAVAGVDTLNRRADDLVQWINQVRIWDIDEGHHVLRGNKWGKAVELFVNAWGVAFTATPTRCDKKGLGRNTDGVYDSLVLGPQPRELIDRGYLADYRIFAPKPSIQMDDEDVSKSTGDYKPESVRMKAHKSTITGDIVESYLKFAPGKRGITFVVDVEIAKDTAAAYNARGVRAQAVSAKTPDTMRTAFIEKFENGHIDQLVNVDLFGEGFDVPAVEVVSMGRPTQSLGLYMQQFGRALRPSEGKTHGIVIDHVGNVVGPRAHGLPDTPRLWSLDPEPVLRKKRKTDDAIPLTSCEACFRAYEAVTNKCPHCGHLKEPAGRSLPEQVDGDLCELDPAVLARMRKEAEAAMQLWDGRIKSPADVIMRRNMEFRRQAQQELRDCIALWAGIGRDVYGRSDSEMYRRFYFNFGIDVATALTLGRAEAEKLTAMIRETIT